jgi:type IV secretory pathway VirB4 component
MNLKYIKTDKCPQCGCNIITEEKIEIDKFNKNKYREHVCGGRWETRKFSCGCTIEYYPNFNQEEVQGECVNSEEYLNREKQRKNFKEAVSNFINTYNDVTDKDRAIMLDKIDFSFWW